MVSFSNTDGAHCDSVVDHYTLPSNSIQMDVKVPVQPSNFDVMQKGALMGASKFMEQDKNHTNQCNYKTKFIPSPGTKFSINGRRKTSVFRFKPHHRFHYRRNSVCQTEAVIPFLRRSRGRFLLRK